MAQIYPLQILVASLAGWMNRRTNGSYTDNTGYDTAWSKRVVIEKPDGTYLSPFPKSPCSQELN